MAQGDIQNRQVEIVSNVGTSEKTSNKGKRRLRSPANPATVKFSPIVSVEKIESFKSHKNAIWYSQGEYNRMKKNLEKSIHRMEAGKLKESSKDCALGLNQMMHQKGFRRNTAREAVLTEQRILRRNGEENDGLIAELYAESSSNAQIEAFMVALRVEKDVVQGNTAAEPSTAKHPMRRRRYLNNISIPRCLVQAGFSESHLCHGVPNVY